jgi:hypothetical protein
VLLDRLTIDDALDRGLQVVADHVTAHAQGPAGLELSLEQGALVLAGEVVGAVAVEIAVQEQPSWAPTRAAT